MTNEELESVLEKAGIKAERISVGQAQTDSGAFRQAWLVDVKGSVSPVVIQHLAECAGLFHVGGGCPDGPTLAFSVNNDPADDVEVKIYEILGAYRVVIGETLHTVWKVKDVATGNVHFRQGNVLNGSLQDVAGNTAFCLGATLEQAVGVLRKRFYP